MCMCVCICVLCPAFLIVPSVCMLEWLGRVYNKLPGCYHLEMSFNSESKSESNSFQNSGRIILFPFSRNVAVKLVVNLIIVEILLGNDIIVI